MKNSLDCLRGLFEYLVGAERLHDYRYLFLAQSDQHVVFPQNLATDWPFKQLD